MTDKRRKRGKRGLTKEERAQRIRELRERQLDTEWVQANKYRHSKHPWKAKRQEEVHAFHDERSERKAESPSRYRRNAKKDEARLRAARKALDKGRKPKPASERHIKGGLVRRVYAYVGLESQPLVEALINSYRHDVTARVTVSIGTGYGKGAHWLGSKTETPRSAWLWMQAWENLPSAQPVLAHADAGGAVWFEVEVLTWE